MDFFSSVFDNQSELGDCDSHFCFFKQDEPSKQKDTSSSAFLALNSSQQIETSNPQDDFVLPISTQSQTTFMNNLFNQAPQPQTQDSNNDAMNMMLNLNAGNILDNYNSVKNLFSSKNNNNNNTNNNNNNNNINGNINQNIHINISSQGSFPGVEIYTQRNEVIPENEHEEEDENNKNNYVGNNGSGCNNVNEKFLFKNVNDASKGKQIMNDNKDNNSGLNELNELFGGFDNKKPNSKISNISSGSFGLVKKKVLDDNDEQEFIIKEKKIDNKQQQQQQNQIRNTYTTSNKQQNQITLTNQNVKRGNKQQQMQQNNQLIDNNSINNTNDIFKQINPTIIQSSSNNNSDTNSINNNNNTNNSTNIVNDYSKLQKLFTSKQSQTKTLKPLLSLFETLYITTEDFKHSFPFLLSSYLTAYSNTISQMNALIPIDDPEIDSLLTQCEYKLSHLSDKFSKI